MNNDNNVVMIDMNSDDLCQLKQITKIFKTKLKNEIMLNPKPQNSLSTLHNTLQNTFNSIESIQKLGKYQRNKKEITTNILSCTICNTHISKNQHYYKSSCCNNYYHRKCIRNLIIYHNFTCCPTCLTSL